MAKGAPLHVFLRKEFGVWFRIGPRSMLTCLESQPHAFGSGGARAGRRFGVPYLAMLSRWDVCDHCDGM